MLLLGTILAVFSGGFTAAAQSAALRPIFTVRDFGARGNGAALETRRLQTAIDACARAGGGQVLVPAGRYRSGTLFLRSGVSLYLDKHAVISASRYLAEY